MEITFHDFASKISTNTTAMFYAIRMYVLMCIALHTRQIWEISSSRMIYRPCIVHVERDSRIYVLGKMATRRSRARMRSIDVLLYN